MALDHGLEINMLIVLLSDCSAHNHGSFVVCLLSSSFCAARRSILHWVQLIVGAVTLLPLRIMAGTFVSVILVCRCAYGRQSIHVLGADKLLLLIGRSVGVVHTCHALCVYVSHACVSWMLLHIC